MPKKRAYWRGDADAGVEHYRCQKLRLAVCETHPWQPPRPAHRRSSEQLLDDARCPAGQPFGRTFSTALNYSKNVRLLAEPIATRRMDNITMLDLRVEKGVLLGGYRRLVAFFDIFNVLNADPEQNTSWSSGPFFLRPLSIPPPRLARAGVKLEW